MKYAFVLGRLPALSVAEILAVMEKLEIKYQIKTVSPKTLVLDIEKEIDFKRILKTMGGTVKIMKLGRFPEEFSDIQNIIKHLALEKANQLNNKIIIGYSVYSTDKTEKNKFNQISKSIKKKLIALKKELKKEGIACRIITPKDYEMELSSASIINNKILEKGIDLNFIITSSRPLFHKREDIELALGKTVAIQDIESYKQRDYERPCREAKIGMMPPKLAQIMLNLAQVKEGQLILDPFCGTGVILQEALLMGCRIIGSDFNEKQVQNSKNNLGWLKENYLSDQFPSREELEMGFPIGSTHPQPPPERGLQILKIDAMHLAKKINPLSVDAIITETTLGPIYTKPPVPKEIRKNFKKLEKVYLKFLTQAKKVLKPDARIVMAVPCYQTRSGKFILMPIVDIFKKTGYSVKEPVPEDILAKLGSTPEITSRNTLIYSRRDQVVGREIIVLE